jgi:hypothetical protein
MLTKLLHNKIASERDIIRLLIEDSIKTNYMMTRINKGFIEVNKLSNKENTLLVFVGAIAIELAWVILLVIISLRRDVLVVIDMKLFIWLLGFKAKIIFAW